MRLVRRSTASYLPYLHIHRAGVNLGTSVEITYVSIGTHIPISTPNSR